MLDFFSFAEEVIGAKTGQSQKTYRTALNAFKAFVGKDTMDISVYYFYSLFYCLVPPVNGRVRSN